MTVDAMLKRKRLDRLKPKAWIGYLVGYSSTNIYKVWEPRTGKVILTRDVIFDEEEVYHGDPERLKEELKEQSHLTVQEISDLINKIDITPADSAMEEPICDDLDIAAVTPPEDQRAGSRCVVEGPVNQNGPETMFEGSVNQNGPETLEIPGRTTQEQGTPWYTSAKFEPYPTPSPSQQC